MEKCRLGYYVAPSEQVKIIQPRGALVHADEDLFHVCAPSSGGPHGVEHEIRHVQPKELVIAEKG
jgi:hypothetical protein